MFNHGNLDSPQEASGSMMILPPTFAMVGSFVLVLRRFAIYIALLWDQCQNGAKAIKATKAAASFPANADQATLE